MEIGEKVKIKTNEMVIIHHVNQEWKNTQKFNLRMGPSNYSGTIKQIKNIFNENNKLHRG